MQTSSYFLIFNGENARINTKKANLLDIFVESPDLGVVGWVLGKKGRMRLGAEDGGCVIVESPDLGFSDRF